MVGSNKILTVSYGTFSCTLEGFDDSFGSMKAIAEYFRDLAQEDRYFGAEPPTPDAEMLARIAERDISRRVEAQIGDNGIHLRAAAPSAAVAALDAAADAVPEGAGAEPEPAGSAFEEDTAGTPMETAEVAMPPQVDAPDVAPLDAAAFMAAPSDVTADLAPTEIPGGASGIAAKLKRIRAVVGSPDAPVADAEEIEASTSTSIPDVADDVVEEEVVAEEAVETAEVEDTAEVDDTAEVEDDATAADLEEDVLAIDEDDAEDVAEIEEATFEEDEVEVEAHSDDEDDASEEEVADLDASDEDVATDDEDAPVEAVADDVEAVEETALDPETSADLAWATAALATAPAETEADDVLETEAEVVAEDSDADAVAEDAPEAEDLSEVAEEVTEDLTGDNIADAVAEMVVADADDTAAEASETTDMDDVAADDAEDVSFDDSVESGLEDEIGDAVAQDDSEDTVAEEEAISDETTDDSADVLVEASDFEDVAEEATEDDDLSSDLSDIDPIVPTISAAASPARIVRIRKDGPAEIVDMADAADDDAAVSVALKTDDDVTEVEEETAADDASSPLVLEDAILDAVTEASQDDDAETDQADAAEIEDETVAEVEEDAEEDIFPAPTGDAAHDDIRAAIAAAMPAGSLSEDDEDDLQRELAAVAEEVVVLEDMTDDADEIVLADAAEDTVEAAVEDIASEEVTPEVDDAIEEVAEATGEVAEEAPTEEAPTAAEPDMPEVVESRPRSRRRLPDADYAVTRMIAQTDEALNEPAGSRRRNAIAQLKAAVAATEAARQLGDDASEKGEAENAFRDDLNQVVRPSKPIETDGEAERPVAAPLKLVASQRVDGEAEDPILAASSTPKTSDADYGGFAKFAASMGATELPDLLEAAAAYTSFVEGVEDFSRPQIMKKVQMTTTEEFSREDGLRSFGTLLRQGRISKVRNGRFQVSEQTRFRPDARSA